MRLPVVVVMGYRDQACLPAQVGLLDESKLRLTAAIQAEKVLDKDIPSNCMLRR